MLKKFVDTGNVIGKGLVMELKIPDLDSIESFDKKFKVLDLPLHIWFTRQQS